MIVLLGPTTEDDGLVLQDATLSWPVIEGILLALSLHLFSENAGGKLSPSGSDSRSTNAS